MESVLVNRFLRLMAPLSMESKFEVISKLTEKLKMTRDAETTSKERLLDELCGSWSGLDDDLAVELIARNIQKLAFDSP